MPGELRLEVAGYTDLTRWRWVLKDANGAFLAGHGVRLDPNDAQFEAFTGLQDYVSWHAAPDKRMAEEARIVSGLGDWIGSEVFGTAIGSALLQRRPAAVEVILPAGAEAIAYLPLEAARVESRSLAGHDITLVIRSPARSDVPVEALRTGTLRVLGLFSLPEGGTALNLRSERQSLVHLVQEIAASGRAADVKVLQYGVTRDKLRYILEEGEGWDVIHISGHGTPGELVLETSGGRPDRISAADLAALLNVACGRVKLVTMSACWSAAFAIAEPRRLLGLPPQEGQRRSSSERTMASPPAQRPAPVATTLAERLGCAVLAMRFPVGDEFAIELCRKLYDVLARQGQPLPSAVGLTLRHLAENARERRFPALSMVAPAIFGATATGLTLEAPPQTARLSGAAGHLKKPSFQPAPDRFVGRTAVMARASAALAEGSGVPGVLLHGMPGVGKTACALELGYTHEDAFEKLIWFEAPDEGAAIDGSLTDFAQVMERDRPGLGMIGKVVSEQALTGFLPVLTELMEQNRILLVIDNAESLLTDTGQWRDQQWGSVVSALTAHAGPGRLILTSRRVPARSQRFRVEPVEALSADETLLLIRELPHLRALISGKLDDLGKDTARNLALGVLYVAQGHPTLLELADRQAARPEQLAALVQAGGQAWQEQGELPDGFFTADATTADPGDYLNVLAAWTNVVTDTLSPGERNLFWFLCCLEEPDRQGSVIASVWPDAWHLLGRGGRPPRLDETLAAITAHGLVVSWPGTSHEDVMYRVHPAVAEAGRAHAGNDFRDMADNAAGAYWLGELGLAFNKGGDNKADTGRMLRAGLSGAPYLTRQGKWAEASAVLASAFVIEPTRANAAAVLPAIKRIAAHDPGSASLLASVQLVLDPARAEATVRADLDAAAARSDYETATVLGGALFDHYMTSGRAGGAYDIACQIVTYTREAGLGPWTQLRAEADRLQAWNAMGHAAEVLSEVQRLRGTLPKDTAGTPGVGEATFEWDVRETLFKTGREAACQLGRWHDALAFNAALVKSRRDRGAPDSKIANARFCDYGPLLKLGRTQEALDLLLECHDALLKDHDRDYNALACVTSALASVEDQRGNGDQAIRMQREALRYSYCDQDFRLIARSYHNLGCYLSRHARQPARAFACHLAAALIMALTGDAAVAGPVHEAATKLAAHVGVAPPADVADLHRQIGDIPGTDLLGLLERQSPDPETADRTLGALITQARQGNAGAE